MKLVFLVISLIVAIVVDCHSQPGSDSQQSIIAEQPQWPDSSFTAETPKGYSFTLGTERSKETTSINSETPWFDIEEEKGQSESELRGSKCKPKLDCSIQGGSCVASGAPCSGRRVPDGCKGSCDCCIPVCPYEEGFFSLTGSKQCFKFFNDKYRNWTDSSAKCKAAGLVMAHPSDAVALRSFLVQTFGFSVVWLNARGDGSSIRWKDTGKAISSQNPLWYPGHPNNVTSLYCLELSAYANFWKNNPTKPILTNLCSRGWNTLCELVL